VGSFGWGGKIVEQLKQMGSAVKAEIFEPVLAKGLPGEQDYQKLDELTKKIAEKHKELIRK